MPSPFDPVEYVQWRTDCTADDIEAWCAIMNEQDAEAFADFATPIYIAALPRRTGPCLGCGRPTATEWFQRSALTVTNTDTPTPTATFQPCGCELRVRTPPILDRIPDGTVPFKKAGIPLNDQIAERLAHQPELQADLHSRLAKYLGQRPDVVMLLDPEQTKARGLHGWALVGYTLHARPGTTKWIVVRGDHDMPPGFMPPGLDGRWQERDRIPDYPPIFEGRYSTATAHPTGRVEIRDDGAIAEVYEMLRTR